MQNYVLLTGIFFVIIGALHLLRALIGWKVLVHVYAIPRIFSFLAGIVALILAWWSFSLL